MFQVQSDIYEGHFAHDDNSLISGVSMETLCYECVVK